MATYVLVHGGGHGGWCYQRVARILRAEGHEVYTPTLTGVGERLHLAKCDPDLDMHIQDVVAVLEYEGLSDVILAGHSYGGMVITGVADRATDRVAQLVYLDAATPQNGQSLDDIAGGLIAEARKDARFIDGVEMVLWPDSASIRHYGITRPEDLAWAEGKLTPHPWKSFEQKLVLSNEDAVRKIPRTDIICTSTPTMEDAPERTSAGADRVWTLDTGHDLMITEPQAVADMLLKLAAGTR
jgi:pimeloyl-ACP methyl ester carboxylesterase